MRSPFFLFCFSIFIFSNTAKAQDSLRTRKNVVELEVLGNNYFSPFSNSDGPDFLSLRLSVFSFNYSRIVPFPHTNCRFTGGIGVCPSENKKARYIYTNKKSNPLLLCLTTGFLWKPTAKQKGLWMGVFFTSAFGTQYNYVEPQTRQGGYSETIKYDGQLTVNFSYQFRATEKGFVTKVSFTPKLSSFFLNREVWQKWGLIPWFGISFGQSW